MEPRIPDGAWCLFTRRVAGSRHGRILIVQHHDIADPETGGSYTIKEYRRLPQADSDSGNLSGTITLKPDNPDYKPILIEKELDSLTILAEFLEILR